MRLSFLLLFALMLAGCVPPAEKAARERISAAAGADWSNGIDPAELAESVRLCASFQSSDCLAVKAKAQAVADAVSTCSGNDSALCSAVSNTKGLHQFQGGRAITLPDHPFYWSLGNELLDAQAWNFSYRGQVFNAWLDRWRLVMLSVSATMLLVIAGWLWWSWRQAEAKKAAQQEAERKGKEAIRRAAEERARQEATRQQEEAAKAAEEAQARAEEARKAREAAKAAEEAQRAVQAEAEKVKEATAAALAAAFGKKKRQ